MDRLAAHVVATAVLTAALATIPTAMAQPAAKTSASPSPSAPASTTPSPSASASASPSPVVEPRELRRERREFDGVPLPCPDAYQVGATAYARWHGAIAFSVKQFYSPKCHARYGYAYPWLQFRVKRVDYDLGLSEFDITHDAIDGARTFVGGAGGPYFWSDPVNVPAGTCTEGLAHVFFPDDETDTYTEKFCL